MSDDYLCLTVRSQPGEAEAAFKARLSAFWTGMLRNQPDEFEKVYAETVKFHAEGDRLTRQYLFEDEIADLLEKQLSDESWLQRSRQALWWWTGGQP